VTADTRKVAVLNGVHEVVIERRPVPEWGSREAIIPVQVARTCGSDGRYDEHRRIWDPVVLAPLVLGDEPSGVDATNADATKRVTHRFGLDEVERVLTTAGEVSSAIEAAVLPMQVSRA
jgi:hypothetical protein